ncbi:hypothetical protein BZA05DRAFT_389755 [Tricharina praecox]|uniref:uncharacterized protein n=1 Tax=Tricharina praecox TaxID=43433 RepID=UPI002220BFD3|nr:uncharacterized protein BZA05DRAFT_389755 [Tricharina praecox]KAI5855819.1 hypothetical protein BZA05DRAFT_389755 [Tricharina praecox]
MMETLVLPVSPPQLSSTPNSLSESSSPATSMDSQGSPRRLPAYLDAFRAPTVTFRSAPPSGSNSSSNYRSEIIPNSLYPASSDAAQDAAMSPRTMPLSFSNLSVHEADTASTSGTSTSPSRLAGSPMLIFRKSSVHSATSHAHSPIYSTSPLRHRRQSVDFALSPSNPKFLALNTSNQELHAPNDNEPYSPTNSAHSAHSAHSFETDPIFPGGLEEEGEQICPRHHHRQSVSSTISITCSSRSPSVVSDDDGNAAAGEGEIEATIPMEPMAPSMLVPLVDRNEEMADLLGHHANAAWVKLVQGTIGADVYSSQCVPLWTATSRREMSDSKWLKKSKNLLETKGCGGICDGRLWNEFCGMVGWDMSSPLHGEGRDDGDRMLRSRGSRDSLGSTSSGKMSSIIEEMEEESLHAE